LKKSFSIKDPYTNFSRLDVLIDRFIREVSGYHALDKTKFR